MTETGRSALRSDLSGPEILRLARKDRAGARARLRALDPDDLAQACEELQPELRSEFLLLLDQPEVIVPRLAEAAICIAIRAGGMSEAAWLLELATSDQLRACFDLDCWNGYELDQPRVIEWLDSLIEAGRSTLVRAIRETDLELWVLALGSMTEVEVLGKEDIPPDGWFTVDGVVYFGPREGVEFAHVREIADATFHAAQPLYWLLVYGLLFESPAECEEYALRWRNARLNDLGFPDREQAMQIYRPLGAEEPPVWESSRVADENAAALMPSLDLPERLRGTLLGQALLELPMERAADILGYVLALANAVAVADQLSLSDSETIPRAIGKALRGVESGLRETARVQARRPSEVLDETRASDLFRIGATLDRALRER